MNNLIRRSRRMLPKTKFSRRIGCLLLLLLVVAAPFTIYFIHNPESLKQLRSHGINLFSHNPTAQSLTLPPQSSNPTPITGKACGATRNSNGTYVFSWLHIANGMTVDEHNCVTHLIGLNMGGLFLAAAGHAGPPAISWYKQHIPMNVVREAYNAYWWDTDVYVPNERMHFRQWLQTVVNWQEQQGNYVILDNATQFHNPPCGDDGMGYHVSLCPSQNQAGKNIPPNPTEKSSYQPTALEALADLARIYANDPAIIFDVWNEPSNKELQGISEKTYFQSMNARINTVRAYDPRSLIMVFDHGLSDIEAGKFPDYTQQNILWDTHIYSPNWNSASITSAGIAFAQSHGQAFIVGEWGGMSGQPVPGSIIPYIRTNNLATTYFTTAYLINGGSEHPDSLNSIGQAVAAGYASILASP